MAQNEDELKNRARGMLVGLAVGDALGAPVEFGYSSKDIEALGDEIAHYKTTPFGPAGSWTDDTSMALCLADSLIECGGYDSYDIMDRFYRWMTKGYRTRDEGKPAIDVGFQTSRALIDYYHDPVFRLDTPATTSAGNGSIMRLAPVVLAAHDPKRTEAAMLAMYSCRETHNSRVAIESTFVFANMLYQALKGKDFGGDGIKSWAPVEIQQSEALARATEKNGESLKNLGGYIVDAVTIALWGMIHFDNFADGMLAVIRLGGDTDTNAAIYGQLAGAHYGYEAIPEEWRTSVYLSDELVELADKLIAMKNCPIIRTRFEGDEHFKKP